jgi:hypothetical protein
LCLEPQADGSYGLRDVNPFKKGKDGAAPELLKKPLPPKINECDVAAVKKWREERTPKWKSKRAREGGRGGMDAELQKRYPLVRGLRFCPESSKFHDRDRTAALAIARLHCLSVLGRPRPQPFSRAFSVA